MDTSLAVKVSPWNVSYLQIMVNTNWKVQQFYLAFEIALFFTPEPAWRSDTARSRRFSRLWQK